MLYKNIDVDLDYNDWRELSKSLGLDLSERDKSFEEYKEMLRRKRNEIREESKQMLIKYSFKSILAILAISVVVFIIIGFINGFSLNSLLKALYFTIPIIPLNIISVYYFTRDLGFRQTEEANGLQYTETVRGFEHTERVWVFIKFFVISLLFMVGGIILFTLLYGIIKSYIDLYPHLF